MPRPRIAENITELVGQTPLLHFHRIVPAGAADVFAKLEYLNPGGSVKDRAAIGIIRKAEEQGRLKSGGTIVEATAGNTGIGLALISDVRRVGGAVAHRIYTDIGHLNGSPMRFGPRQTATC